MALNRRGHFYTAAVISQTTGGESSAVAVPATATDMYIFSTQVVTLRWVSGGEGIGIDANRLLNPPLPVDSMRGYNYYFRNDSGSTATITVMFRTTDKADT